MAAPDDRITFELALFGSASRSITAFLAEIEPEQLDRPSPCTSWSGRDVLNHMVGSAHLFAAAARGERPEFSDWDTACDVVGDDPECAYVLAADAVTRAFVKPGVLEGDVVLPFTTARGSVALKLIMADHATHAWDLAQCATHPLPIDDTVAAMALDTLRASVTPQLRAAGYYAPETVPPARFAPLDDLAAFTGRVVAY
jgi:uncharacterized protein (TIGR03086 family)